MSQTLVKNAVLLRLMSASITVANQCGKIIRQILKKENLGIIDKGFDDLQTEADRSVQRCIVNSLSRQFPRITIIGEETLEKLENEEEFVINLSNCDLLNVQCPEKFSNIQEEEVVIWVDPLDGTKEFTQGLLDHATVLIGIAINGQAAAGIIHQPFYNYLVEEDSSMLGRTIWGIVGSGTNGIDAKPPPSNKRIITTTRSHSNPVVKKTIASLNPDEVLAVGGAGHKVLLVMEGKAHAYVFPSAGCKKWDTCAPEAVLTALGGKLTDISGEAIQYHAQVEHVNSGGVLATYLASEHDWFCTNIPQDIKDSLKSKI